MSVSDNKDEPRKPTQEKVELEPRPIPPRSAPLEVGAASAPFGQLALSRCRAEPIPIPQSPRRAFSVPVHDSVFSSTVSTSHRLSESPEQKERSPSWSIADSPASSTTNRYKSLYSYSPSPPPSLGSLPSSMNGELTTPQNSVDVDEVPFEEVLAGVFKAEEERKQHEKNVRRLWGERRARMVVRAMKEEAEDSDGTEMPVLCHYNNGFGDADGSGEEPETVVVTNGEDDSRSDASSSSMNRQKRKTSRRRVQTMDEQVDEFIRRYAHIPPPPPNRNTKYRTDIHPDVMKRFLGCLICKRVMERPVRIVACSHRFCATCFQRHYSTNKRCPLCGQKIEEQNGELAVPCPHFATLIDVFFGSQRPEVAFPVSETPRKRSKKETRSPSWDSDDEMGDAQVRVLHSAAASSSSSSSSSDDEGEVVDLSELSDPSADEEPTKTQLGAWGHAEEANSGEFPSLRSLSDREMRCPISLNIVPRAEMSHLARVIERRQRKIYKFERLKRMEAKQEAGPSKQDGTTTPPKRRGRISYKSSTSPFPRPTPKNDANESSRRYADDEEEDEDEEFPDDPSISPVRVLRKREHTTHNTEFETLGRRRAATTAPSIMQPLRKKQRGGRGTGAQTQADEDMPALLPHDGDQSGNNSGADGDDEGEMDDLPSLGRESRYSPAPVYRRLDRSIGNPVIAWPDMHVHNSLIDKDFLLQRFFILPNEAQVGHLAQAILERFGREHGLKDVNKLLTCHILPVLGEFLIGDLLILDVSSQNQAQALEPISIASGSSTNSDAVCTVNPVSVSFVSSDSDSASSRSTSPDPPVPRAANPNSTFITVRYPHEPLNPDMTVEEMVTRHSKVNFIPGVLKVVYSITDRVDTSASSS